MGVAKHNFGVHLGKIYLISIMATIWFIDEQYNCLNLNFFKAMVKIWK